MVVSFVFEQTIIGSGFGFMLTVCILVLKLIEHWHSQNINVIGSGFSFMLTVCILVLKLIEHWHSQNINKRKLSVCFNVLCYYNVFL